MGWRAVRGAWRAAAPGMGRVMPGVGAVLMVAALCLAAGRWWQERALVRADGMVTENVATFAPKGGVVLAPRVRFQDQRGQLLTVVTRPSKSWEALGLGFDVGQQVPVLYPSGRPEQAMIAVWWRWYAWAVWVGTLGVVVFDVGWVARRQGVSG